MDKEPHYGDTTKVLVAREPDRTYSNCFKLDKFRSKKSRGKNRFTNREVVEWNTLCSHVVSANAIGTFKWKYDKLTSGGVVRLRFTKGDLRKPTGLPLSDSKCLDVLQKRWKVGSEAWMNTKTGWWKDCKEDSKMRDRRVWEELEEGPTEWDGR